MICFKCGSNLNLLKLNLNSFKYSYINSVSTRQYSSSKRNISVLGWVLLSVPITTFGLGCWQVQRKSWKENLMKELEEKTAAHPVNIPDNLEDLQKMEYLPVKLRGKFDHQNEIYMGPRSFISKGDGTTHSGLFSQGSKGIGYNVITPFQIDGREEKILVNRGWIPKNTLNPTTRLSGQVDGTIEITGVVRAGETRPQFSPDHKGNIFFYRDLAKMCTATGSEPYYLDARFETTISGGPVGGQTRATLRNDHLSYLITWFSLSAFSSLIWYAKVLKRI